MTISTVGAEIETVVAINTPTAEERAKRLAADPKMRTRAEWYLNGFKLDDIHKPTPLRTATISTSPADLVLVPTSTSVTPLPPSR